MCLFAGDTGVLGGHELISQGRDRLVKMKADVGSRQAGDVRDLAIAQPGLHAKLQNLALLRSQ